MPDSQGSGLTVPALRIGQGFDVHPWTDSDRLLTLGGVTFPGHAGLEGHSDADVIAHACTDALLGAAGMGDIGVMFPDTDPGLVGADSIEMLRKAVGALADVGFHPVNVDCTVVLDSPKIAPHRSAMQDRLSAAVGAPVTVKGKRTEGLESLQQGLRCYAVALVATR